MATLVCFHAHPDDEAISTGGLMAAASAKGHRVVLVCATRGEVGEPQEGVLAEGETLAERRVVELAASTAALGAEPPIFLDYEDSGMMGEPSNDNPASFWQADHDEAVARLASILRDVDATVLTIYDDHGGYGHPDHLRVHSVGLAAGEAVGVEHIFEATMNRDYIRVMIAEMAESNPEIDDPEIDVDTMGTAESDISYKLDVRDMTAAKREAMIAHRSQIGPDSFFLTMPDEAFTEGFGLEFFNVPGRTDTGGPETVSMLPGL